MNNEPVAWRTVVDGKTYVTDDNEFVLRMWQHNGWKEEPLYTHPADLTDEEILNCMGCLPKYNSEIVDEDLVKFARAILNKAQEK